MDSRPTYDWTRWWFPGDVPLDHLDFLQDPASDISRFGTRDARRLEDLRDEPCLVLLGAPGLGKSHELSKVCEGTSTSGPDATHYIDLGRYQHHQSIDRAMDAAAIRQWRAGTHILTLFLDGLDEVLARAVDIPEIIEDFVAEVDTEKLRLRIACRDSRWPQRLNGALKRAWPRTTQLNLGPLTRDNVRTAAAANDLDADTFLADIAARGVGVLASRPMTLRFLIAAAQEGDLPARRSELYAVGVERLLLEPDDRRRQRDDNGLPVAERLRAASRAAAVTLLTGAPSFVPRELPKRSSKSPLALERLVGGAAEITIDALEALSTTALVDGTPDHLRWMHRSVEEYLCASELERVSDDAIIELLTHPDDPSLPVQQFLEVATFIAEDRPAIFHWLAARQPEAVLGPPMVAATPELRRALVRTLIEHLSGAPLPDAWADLSHLDYDGFDEVLRPLLEDGQEWWIRRTALRMVAANSIHTLDDRLLEIVTTAIHLQDPDAQRIQETDLALQALSGSARPDVISQLKVITENAEASETLRASVIDILWPQHLATSDLPRGETVDRYLVKRIARRIHRQYRREQPTPEVIGDLLAWALAHQGLDHLTEFQHIIQLCVPRILALGYDESAAWPIAVTAIRRTANNHHIDGRSLQPGSLADSDRKRLIVDLIDNLQPHQAGDLVDDGWIIPADLPVILGQHDAPAPGVQRSTINCLVALLAPHLPVEEIDVLAAQVSPDAAVLLDAVAGPAVRQQLDVARAAKAEQRAQREAEWASRQFQIGRLDRLLKQGSWGGVRDELDRSLPPSTDVPTGRAPAGLRAWGTLDPARRDRVVDVAAEFLAVTERAIGRDAVFEASAAHDILATHRPDAFERIPVAAWLRWLPGLLGLHGHEAARTGLRQVSGIDQRRADNTVIDWLRNRARAGQFDGGVLIYAGVSDAVATAALALAREVELHPKTRSELLRIVGRAAPYKAAEQAVRWAQGGAEQTWTAGDVQVEMSELGARCLQVVVHLKTLTDVLSEVLAMLEPRPSLSLWILHASASHAESWGGLTAAQCVAVYEWAVAVAPPRRRLRPGESGSIESVSAFPDRVLGRLEQEATEEAAEALARLASRSGNPWHGVSAVLAKRRAAEACWPALSVGEILDVLDDDRVAVRTSAELARLIHNCLREINEDVNRDRTRKAWFWHRQRTDDVWGMSVPMEEREVSDLLARLVTDRLSGRIAALREVQIQPRLAGKGSDNPDLVIIGVDLTSGQTVSCPVEVKCSYNDEVITGLHHQLKDRYQQGPAGDSGVYVVAAFGGKEWSRDDRRRRKSKSIDDIRAALGGQGPQASSSGTTYVSIISLLLED